MGQQHRVGKVSTKIRTKGKTTHIKYHNTDVVSFTPKTVTLRTGGWNTATTKSRMNQASSQYRLGYDVYQKKGKWFVEHKGKVLPFKGSTLKLRR